MSCTWRELWALAQRLRNETPSEEATLRCACSRAYYAALHSTWEIFPIDVDTRRRGESSHEYLIRRATEHSKDRANPGYREAAKLAERLHSARRLRNRIDYDLGMNLLPSQVNDMFAKVEAILRLCEAVRAARLGSSNTGTQ